MDKSTTNTLPQHHVTFVDWKQGNDLGCCMTELYNRGVWTDVQIRCNGHQEGERIEAHKVILAARSPVFRAMFFGPCADGSSDVNLENVDAKIFDLFLRYLYSDTITLSEETASAVLETAHYYQVTGLVQYCAKYLATVITIDNACGILTLAVFYDITSLRDACSSFIDRHAEQVLHSQGFVDLPEESLLYILKGDTFYAREDLIFVRAEEWASKKLNDMIDLEKYGSSVRTILGESFFYLRVPTMTSNMLMDCTRKKGYFSVDEYEEIIDVINQKPGASVSSNCCIRRVPLKETIVLNVGIEAQLITDSICTTFEISVSEDVALSKIILSPIEPYMKHSDPLYTCSDCPVKRMSQKDVFGNLFPGRFSYLHDSFKVIKARKRDRYYDSDYDITEMKAVHGLNLQDYFCPEIQGTLSIKCIGYKQNFQSSQLQENTLILNQPLKLTKEASPFTVEMKLRLKGQSRVQMKVQYCKRPDPVANGNKQIQLRTQSGSFVGINCIEFQNYSNRENAEAGHK